MRQQLNTVASALGKGLVAGFVGTAAMTASSSIEARIRGRSASTSPARATAKVLGISGFENPRAAARFNDLSHWGFGTAMGALRGLLGTTGMSSSQATAAHGVAVWGGAQVALPTLEIAPPSVFWARKEIAIDAFHHAVYAAATGAAFHLIDRTD
jgi:hypothetical protein